MDKFEFLPNDFEFVGEAHDITKDYIAPAKPAWKDALDRFAKNKGAVIGACVIILFAILVFITPIGIGFSFTMSCVILLSNFFNSSILSTS